MNNEFNQHKKSDFIKWIITFTTLILLSISVIALAANVFGGVNNDTTTETEQTTGDTHNDTVDPLEPIEEIQSLSTMKIVNSPFPYQYSIFLAIYATRSSTCTLSCSMVSRSRTVTMPVSCVSKSTVMQYGVPISS